MRSKWYKSNAPALQMALMKLIATPEELKKLSMQFVESENKNENTVKNISVEILKPNED
jgi:transcriptional accessory protein Tex/SPT6